MGQDFEPVRSRIVEIDYDVGENAFPLDSVQLWVTADRGQTWKLHCVDADRQSPVVFESPGEGLYGLFVVVRNATGPSSMEPSATTQPHRWVFVDVSPPVVQLHPLRQTVSLGYSVLLIRWTAVDANLTTRPIQIAYRLQAEKTWRPVCSDALANTGRFDWRLPETLSGSVSVRVTVTDRGGHRVDSATQLINVTGQGHSSYSSPDLGVVRTRHAPSAIPGSARSKKLAERAYLEAISYRDRGDVRRGVARMRDALRYDPDRADVFVDMAAMLYELSDLDRSLNAYDLALRQEPRMRSALLGSAKVFSRRKEFEPASQRLRKILRYNPSDAEAWMNLGDVAVYQGDELLARECYTRATQIDPEAKEVIRDAQQRLTMMAEVSRGYNPKKP